MRLYFAICVCLLASVEVFGKAEVEIEDNVLILTEENFDEVFAENQYLLVDFYAPWCGPCKAMAPEYKKAATILAERGSEIKLAKIDATEEEELGDRYRIGSFPTIIFFYKGSSIEYNGDRTAEAFIRWLTKKTTSPGKELNSLEEAEAFIDSEDVVVIGFFKDRKSPGALAYLQVATVIDDFSFGITSDSAVFSKYAANEGSVKLFKKFDEGVATFNGELTENEITDFVQKLALPLTIDLNFAEDSLEIFNGEINVAVIFLLSKEAGHYEKYLDGIKDASKDFRGKAIFVTINADDDSNLPILALFNANKGEVPIMRIVSNEGNGELSTVYTPKKSDLSSENIRTFLTEFLDDKLSPQLLGDDLPEDWDKHPVKILVGANFFSVALDPSKNVLIDIYASWEKENEKLDPIFEQLAKNFESQKDIVIAKIDVAGNEIDKDLIDLDVPTVVLYSKDNKKTKFVGELTLEELTNFLESGGTYKGEEIQKMSEEKEEEEDKK